MTALLGSRLVGVYLHGSAVLGGFDVRRSDVDVLVVCIDSARQVDVRLKLEIVASEQHTQRQHDGKNRQCESERRQCVFLSLPQPPSP
jgi:predicted nucleotidyltransferase